MEHMLYFFIGGMICWVIISLIFPTCKQEFLKMKSNSELDLKFFLSSFLFFLQFAAIITLAFLGLVLNYSALSMLIIWLSTVMFNSYTPGMIEYKDFLGIFVQITSLFGTVSIAVAAYIFKKKS